MNLWQKTKLIFALKSAFNKAGKELNANPHIPMKLKPGISTSEFWTTFAFGLGSLLLATLGMLDGNVAVAATTILGAVYTASRAIVKGKSE